MKLSSEQDILDPVKRKRIIQAIREPENRQRRFEALKAYDVYKDLTIKYVIENLRNELESETVQEMKSRAANISFAKKIVNKKARVYKKGAIRKVVKSDGSEFANEDEQMAVQSQVDDLYTELKVDAEMKMTNRYLELKKNTMFQVVPIQNSEGKFTIKPRALPCHLYDVIEDPNDPELPMVLITSPFDQRNESFDFDVNEGRGIGGRVSSFRQGDNRDQKIADSEADEGVGDGADQNKIEYVWWTKNFHFTTDQKGSIIPEKSPEDLINPINMEAFHSFNKDQDGSYWAVGGEDLVRGSILINQLLTDMFFIGKLQGMGIFYLFGKNIPKRMKIGPNHAITVEVEEGDPSPQIGFASSNPPLDQHMSMIEQYIALLLSTNDLAANTVQGDLTANNAASGIQELIVRSEVTGAIEDEEQIFLDAEPIIFDKIRAWFNFYFDRKLLTDKLMQIGRIPEDITIRVKFMPFQEFLTEEQKLNIIEKRKQIGLDTFVDSIKRDNPELNDEQAEEKALQIQEEKLQRSMMMFGNGQNSEPPQQGDQDAEEDNNQAEN